MTHRKRSGLALAFVLAVLPICGYVGGYYALVKPWPLPGVASFTGVHHVWVAGYPCLWMHSFFRPIHRFDRWLRPNVWYPPPGP